ncbi:MAG TPA: Ig-like domain-containing protein, partial [Propionicimonas sp.]|nr:Ig-like domain-containing protein [Propionicimonas sp.]
MVRGKGRQLWSALAVVVSSAVIATMAVLYQGYTTADVDLNDGGVWVYTATPSSIIGHLNYPSQTLDASVVNIRTDIELLQDGNTVATYEEASGTLSNIDVPTAALDGDGALAAGSKVALKAGVVGIVDASSGGLFTSPTTAIKGLSLNGRDPVSKLGVGAQVAVDVTGTVHGVSVEKSELVSVTKQGALNTKQFDAFVPKAAITITTVGTTPVVLDSANGLLYTPDRLIQVPDAKGGVLQQAGATNDRVLIATQSGLVSQPLDGSAAVLTPVAGNGLPSAPVWLDGCGYAVWSGSAAYVRDCPEATDDRNEVIAEAGNEPKLVLRQNRHVVVVNELSRGTVWLINENMVKVDNWTDVIPPDSEDGEEDESPKEEPLFKIPERSAKNHRPSAKADQFGVRAGATAILPVLENDTDPDGDLLAASLEGQTPATAIVQTVQSGAALQVAVGANATGDVTFTYRVDDGRTDGTAEAKVTLHVRSADSNQPPGQQKVQTVPLELGATVTYDALLGWRDPDSDDLYLKRAWVEGEAEDDKVTFRNNGVIQFTEATGERGIHEVNLLVSDGKDDFPGLLRVDVRAKGSLAPVVSADRFSALVGQQITVAPLDNDRSGSGKQLRLAKVEQVADAKISPPDTGGTFSFTGSKPGAYYVGYLTTDGPNTASGIVRIDVLAESKDGLPPLAARDTALLPVGREVLVDVLANDTDPMGSILVLQSVIVPRGSKVSAEVLEHRIIRVKDIGQLSSPATITYRVSNGSQWAEGTVRILPVALPEKLQPPTTQQDRAVVRAGDVVTVDVLANDYHPDGDRLTLMPELKEVPDAADGTAFLSENRVRFKAAAAEEPKTVSIVYEVTDSADNITAGYLTIQIVPADAETNSPPKPAPVTARVVAGTSVRIPIPLDGIDSNGDSVELIGTASTPRKGRVSVGDTWLIYEAYAGETGRDDLEYLVRDRYGATATGSLVVGIVAPSTQNQPPYTATDEVTVRPGRDVSVAVLQNDSDPDGDEVALSSKGLTTPNGAAAEVVKARVLVHAPTEADTYPFTYRAVDPYGAKSEG